MQLTHHSSAMSASHHVTQQQPAFGAGFLAIISGGGTESVGAEFHYKPSQQLPLEIVHHSKSRSLPFETFGWYDNFVSPLITDLQQAIQSQGDDQVIDKASTIATTLFKKITDGQHGSKNLAISALRTVN